MRARGRSGGCGGRALTVTNETGGYDATLEQFARGKRLARLAKYVRARSDDHCDACGSTLPRLLFGLKGALIFEPPRTNFDPMLIVIAISRLSRPSSLSRPSNGGPTV